jgi:hypothetical protein
LARLRHGHFEERIYRKVEEVEEVSGGKEKEEVYHGQARTNTDKRGLKLKVRSVRG